MDMKKITAGFVVQDYDDHGKCISQVFIASDEDDGAVKYEDAEGDQVDGGDEVCFPLDMIQP